MREPDWSYRVFMFMMVLIVVLLVGFAFFALGVATTYIPVRY